MWRRVPCEQQLNMGQAVLSDLVTQLLDGDVYCCNSPEAKGKRVKIPVPATEIGASAPSAVTQTNWETSAEVPGRVLFSL